MHGTRDKKFKVVTSPNNNDYKNEHRTPPIQLVHCWLALQ